MYEEELAFLRDEDRWPNWPLCPVVRRDGPFSEKGAGVLFGSKPIVYLANLFNLNGKKLDDFEKVEYTSFEEMLEVWRID